MYCEQCGAEMEQGARFCSMCGSQAGEPGAAGASGQQYAQAAPARDVRILQRGLIAALAVVSVLGGALLWVVRPDNGNVTDGGASAGAITKESKTELSRKEAETMIVEHERYPMPVEVAVSKFEKIWGTEDSNVVQFNNGTYGILQNGGLTENSFTQVTDDIAHPLAQEVTIQLTEKGKQFLIRQTKDDYYVKGCERRLLEVTGIAPMGFGFNGAQVEYEEAYDNPTPFASLGYPHRCMTELGKPDKRTITFRLYDDGWRPR